ncbi:hypothetical protein FDM98_03005 [Microbacterium sp. TL13]|uniref:hypothetical protein n=1 Tax=Microbacterium sp. TL13 TaxID=2576306 RepID=UPI00136FB6C0|nr:hypothetical protein [Microbacterium sp. TL13]MXS73636.1 hypothetical protein [Microbacterium sp. TL13]
MAHSDGGSDYRTMEAAKRVLLADLGQLALLGNGQGDSREHLFRYLAECDDDMVPSVIEAFMEGYATAFQQNAAREAFASGLVPSGSRIPFNASLIREINGVLAEDRIAFELIDGEMVPFASRELHIEVVEPVLRLLAKPGWQRVEKSYQSALSQIARGDGTDAHRHGNRAPRSARPPRSRRQSARRPNDLGEEQGDHRVT